MMSSEPAATACMPGDTPIDTVAIVILLAAKKPLRAATTPGHTVAVGDTWPKDTLSAARTGAAGAKTASAATENASAVALLTQPEAGEEVFPRPRKAGHPVFPAEEISRCPGPR